MIGVPGGACRLALSKRLASTCPIRGGSTSTSGRSGATDHADCPVSRARSRGRRPTPPPVCPTDWGVRWTSSTPASIRVMSSRLVTSRVRRSVSTSISPWSSSVAASESGDDRVQERRRGHLHRGQRRAQIVGDRTHQRVPQPVDLLQQLRTHGLLPELGPLQGQRRVIGEGPEEGPRPPRMPARPAWPGSPPGGRPRSAPPSASHRPRPDPCPGSPAPRTVGRAGGARPGTAPRRLRRRPPAGPPSGTSRVTPGTPKTVRTVLTIVSQQLLDGPVLDQQLGQLEEPARLGRPARWASRAGRVEVGHHPGHQQHHDHVDDQGHPVLAVRHPELVVGRDEPVVVDEEAGGHAGHAGRETRRR